MSSLCCVLIKAPTGNFLAKEFIAPPSGQLQPTFSSGLFLRWKALKGIEGSGWKELLQLNPDRPLLLQLKICLLIFVGLLKQAADWRQGPGPIRNPDSWSQERPSLDSGTIIWAETKTTTFHEFRSCFFSILSEAWKLHLSLRSFFKPNRVFWFCSLICWCLRCGSWKRREDEDSPVPAASVPPESSGKGGWCTSKWYKKSMVLCSIPHLISARHSTALQIQWSRYAWMIRQLYKWIVSDL